MKNTLKILGLFSALFLTCNSASAEVADIKNNRVELLELSIDATATKYRADVHCNPTEIKKGVWNLVSFAERLKVNLLGIKSIYREDMVARDLESSYYPLERKAAWYISNDECKSLAPYLNGVGFDSYNSETGEAVIYLAAFEKKPIDQKKWTAANGEEYGHLALFFQPPFNVYNVTKFHAQCDLKPAISTSLGLTNGELVCTLDIVKGSLRFALHPKDP